MSEIQVFSVSDVVKYIEDNCSFHQNIYFRGQRCDYPLLPSLARINPLYRKEGEKDYVEAEQRLIRNFKKKSLPFLEMVPSDEWEWLAVAQHYGLRTRLLDWSLNALASLWFAVCQEPLGHSPGVLWVLKPQWQHYYGRLPGDDRKTPYEINRSIIFSPSYVSRRIVAQRGYFTAHRNAEQDGSFLPLNEDPDYEGHLTKIIIPAEVFYEFRYDLNRLGINAMTIYPDLSGLCQEINWKYSYMADEEFFEMGTRLPRKSDGLRRQNPGGDPGPSTPRE